MPTIGAAAAPASVVGRLVAVDGDGVAVVDWDGNPAGPVAARTIVQLDAASAVPGTPVLLAFAGASAEPLVVGVVHERLVRPSPPADGARVAVSADGRSLSLDAVDRIELRCGGTAIVLTADGDVVIRGARVTSRATETHKIRGAAVLIN